MIELTGLVPVDQLESSPGDLGVALAQLAAAELLGDEQGDTRDRITDFCSDHPDALWRTCWEGHFTGSALVVDQRGESMLLIHHRKLNRWLQPGGHADGEANLALVALTEATEETGVDGLVVYPRIIHVDIHGIPARQDDPAHVHLDCRFLVVAPADASVEPDVVETMGACWVGPEDPRLAKGELSQLARRALALWPGPPG